jgi:plastocyanin
MKCFSIGLVFILVLATASAELYLNPNPINIKVRLNEVNTFSLILNNTYNFKITDITFSNLTGFNFPNIELLPNQAKILYFNVTRTSSGIFSIPSKVSFKYNVDIPVGKTNHNISITELGYEPEYLIVRKGDSVKWINKDDITHTVTSSTFDYSLSPNQSVELHLNNLGEINYQDLILFYAGRINVINETTEEKVNNPNYDTILNVNLEVTLNPTTISISNNKNNYSIDYSGSKEGILTISNTGNEIAERIILSSYPSWIQFDENNFNLAKGEENFITYHINPLITKTEDTNKTHNLIIQVSGSNIASQNISLNVFIPYNNVFDDINTAEGFAVFYERYCLTHPNFLICNNTIQQYGGNTTIVRDVEIPINLSASSVYAMLKRIQRIEDSNERTNNEVKKLADQMGMTVPELMNLLNQSVSMQKNNEDSAVSRIRATWIILIFLTICGCILTIALAIKKRMYRKSIVQGGYNQ